MEDLTKIDELILAGALEVAGIDPETNEFMYNFTEKLKDVAPGIYETVINGLHSDILYFWQIGILEMDIVTLNPSIRLTPKAFDESVVGELPDAKKAVLKEIIRQLSQQ